jgi:single-stranded DNA-specific DHH superfamily exonuclease
MISNYWAFAIEVYCVCHPLRQNTWQKKIDDVVETMMITTKGDFNILTFDNRRFVNKLIKRMCKYQNKCC